MGGGERTMATYVLVSGAWHAAWCWERIVPLLRGAGHAVVAPDLIGMTADGVAVETVTLAGWADQVARVVAAQAEPVILVGHSRGGIVISEAAERVPDRVAMLVYLAAFLVPDGATLAGVSARGVRDIPDDAIILSADGLTSTVRPDQIGPVFYTTTDDEWAARAAAQLRPEPMAAMATPLVLGERFAGVRRGYIECLRDRAVPIALQRAMQADLPCETVVTLDTDHSPFFSAPVDLAAALLAFV